LSGEGMDDINQLSTYDLISRHAVAVMQWSVDLNKSYCSSGLTQNL
jgi:hypothetical protein